MKRLEHIVERMEKGDLPRMNPRPLQEGIELSRICTRQLNAADEHVRKLVRVENGRFVLSLRAGSPPSQDNDLQF